MSDIEFTTEIGDFYFFKCPHCQEEIIVHKNEVNCKIFRHGVYKSTKKQIDPHMKKEECDRLYNFGEIYGCGKPFRFVFSPDGFHYVIICDYI